MIYLLSEMQQETQINVNQRNHGPLPVIRRRPRLQPQKAINFDDEIEECDDAEGKSQRIEIGVWSPMQEAYAIGKSRWTS